MALATYYHNTFGKGQTEYGKAVNSFVVDLHKIFKYSAARREDFRKLQLNLDLEQKVFLEHTILRWLSIGPSVQRIMEQWKAIAERALPRKWLQENPWQCNLQASSGCYPETRYHGTTELPRLSSFSFQGFPVEYSGWWTTNTHPVWANGQPHKDISSKICQGGVVKSVSAPGLKKLYVSWKNQFSDRELTLGGTNTSRVE